MGGLEGVTRVISNVLSRAIVTYAVALTILFGIVNPRTAMVERLNVVLGWGDYPARLESGDAPYDERLLRFAVRYYKMVAQLLPQSDQPYAMIGYCYSRLGENARAIKYYEKALGKSGDHFWLEYNLGMLYARSGDSPRAYAAFQNIAGRDINAMAQASVLSALLKMPPENQRLLFARAGAFAVELKKKSFQMLVKMDLEGRRYSQALATALTAANHSAPQDKGLFLLFAGAASFGAGQTQEAVVFCRIAVLTEAAHREWRERFLAKAIDQVNDRAADPGDLWQRFLSDPEVFPQAGTGVVLHPWAFYIPPGKEMYY